MKQTSSPAWLIAVKAILLFLLVISGLLGFAVLRRATNSFTPALLVLVAGLIIGLIWAGLFWLWRRRRPDQPPFWQAWLKAAAVWSLVLLALVAVPFVVATFVNIRNPLIMPRVVLTDGEKEVVFQGMVHVASGTLYEGVVFDMTQAADQGYDLFFEGVRPGSEENQQLMGEILGTKGQNLNQFYDQFAGACQLRFQNDYFGIFYDDIVTNPDQYYNADVSVDDMMNEWRRLLEEHPEWRAQQVNERPEDEVDNQLTNILDIVDNLSPGQRDLVELACHTMMNIVFSEVGGEKPPFKQEVVLNFRNRHLADTILAHPGDTIYVTYGYDHFRGVFRMLQEANPAWEIVDVRWRPAIQPRAEVEGELLLEPPAIQQP
jgi:hypothetical protein